MMIERIRPWVQGKKVLILLDEYDTPMQEAYVEDGTVLFLIVKADLDDMT